MSYFCFIFDKQFKEYVMKNATTNKDVITALRLKSKELQDDIERCEGIISKNKDIIESLNKSIIALGGNITENDSPVLGGTFKDRVKKIFIDGRPRTSRQIYNDFLKAVPDTKIDDFYGFSGRFSNIMKPAGIKKHKIPENPINSRFIYGLSEWFNQDNLKEEYLNKVIYE